jgi:hypothetical protein
MSVKKTQTNTTVKEMLGNVIKQLLADTEEKEEEIDELEEDLQEIDDNIQTLRNLQNRY